MKNSSLFTNDIGPHQQRAWTIAQMNVKIIPKISGVMIWIIISTHHDRLLTERKKKSYFRNNLVPGSYFIHSFMFTFFFFKTPTYSSLHLQESCSIIHKTSISNISTPSLSRNNSRIGLISTIWILLWLPAR